MSDSARPRFALAAAGLSMMFGWTIPAISADRSRPVVAGFERFASGTKGDPSSPGSLLAGELNCTSCHKASPALDAHLLRKQAPILDGVGSRVRASHLSAFLADPHSVKPGTTMPDVFRGWPAAEKATAVDALTHFLASTGGLPSSRPDRRASAEGKTLYHRIGCVACHGPIDGNSSASTDTARPVPLGDLVGKYSIPSLSAFLLDPLKVRPSGRMPGLRLSGQEANAIAHYLLKDLRVDVRPNLAYHYYEGHWDKLPDFASLKPRATGTSDGLDVTIAPRKDDIALRFEGFLRIDREGRYTFHLASDDSSRLLIDGKTIVDNDGIHPAQDRAKSIKLTRGMHRFVVEYFNAAGEIELEVGIEGAGISRQDVAGYLSLRGDEPDKTTKTKHDPDHFTVDPAKSETGRDLFARVGCASCHQLQSNSKPIASKIEARPWAALAGSNGGCLAETPPKGSPAYDLDLPQRSALLAAIKASPALERETPSHDRTITRSLTAFHCYACHQRGEVGGVEPSRNAAFETTQKEMGDEGRIPPRLDGVGAKLNESYLKDVLAEGVKDRPYMLTRMPRFGGENTKALATAFATIDTIEPVKPVEFTETTKRIKSTGRSLVGSDGLSCIKCHTFKGSEAEGIQAIDMTIMPRRLRRDWFHRYVVNPPAFRPGTRMPTAWPDGKSILPNVLGGDTPKQVEAVWRYLSDGASAVTPAGLGRQPIPLFAIGDAVIYRNFIEGGGTRAIGVGYPERANLAFDANNMQLALIWQGGFMDASRHWIGRGEGYQPPMGDNVVSPAPGVPFATLPSPTSPWPDRPARELGYKFRGYRLTPDQRPTFLYEFATTRVEDHPDAIAGKSPAGLKRTLTLTSDHPPDALQFRAAVGETIKSLPDGWFLVNGEWKVRINAIARPFVRTSNGKQELIVPITFTGKTATLDEQFDW
jgi:mono/diheme cytochrome c family protein